MSSLKAIVVGKTEKGFAGEGVEFYLKRIQPFQPLEWIEVRSAAHSGRDPGQALGLEAEAILKRVTPTDILVLLDERGKTPSTLEFARMLESWSTAPGACVFVIGGAYGVAETIKRRATFTVALSRLTFPHQLVRVILLEQLYRALTVLAGHGYHHE